VVTKLIIADAGPFFGAAIRHRGRGDRAALRLPRETLSARDLVQKGAAAVLVAAGVALVTRA